MNDEGSRTVPWYLRSCRTSPGTGGGGGGGKGPAEGNAASKTRPGRSAGQGAPSELDRVREGARRDRKVRFTALLHHVSVERLRDAYRALPEAAPGVDGVTWREYGEELEENLSELHARVHRAPTGQGRLAGCIIPKADGRQRPLGVAALEDKIVQRAVVEVLNANLRGGLSRLLLRVPPGAWPA